MGLPMATLGADIIVAFWPTQDEDDYMRRAIQELDLSKAYQGAAEELRKAREFIEEATKGKAAEETKKEVEKTAGELEKSAKKSESSSSNLAFRAQSIFNLKNILNTIAWGFWNFIGRIISFFFGDPVAAEQAKKVAEDEAELAASSAERSDKIAEKTTTDNIESGTHIKDNPPSAYPPMVDRLTPGNNVTAGMSGTQLYDNNGNLLGTLNPDGTLNPAQQGMGQMPQQGMGQMPQQGMGQMPQQGMGQMPQQGMGQMPQQNPYYGPVYDQNGKVLNQLPPQQVFGQNPANSAGTPQAWGNMPNTPSQYQDLTKTIPNTMNPDNYGYNGTPQGLTDSLAKGGQQMVAQGIPGAPEDLVKRFTDNLSKLSNTAAQLVGIVHEAFGVTPPDTADLGEGDVITENGDTHTTGGGTGAAPMAPQGNSGGDEEGAHANEGGNGSLGAPSTEGVADTPPAPEHAPAPDPVPTDGHPETADGGASTAGGGDETGAAERAGEAPAPVPEPAPAPAPAPPAPPKPLFSLRVDLGTPLFSFHSTLDIGTHLTSGAAVPVMSAPSFAPAAAAGGSGAAGLAGGMGGFAGGFGGFGAGRSNGSSFGGGSGKAWAGRTQSDPAHNEPRTLLNGGHGSAEVSHTLLKMTHRDDHEMSAPANETEVVDVTPVEEAFVADTPLVDDSTLSMLPPLTARGARVVACVSGELAARGISGDVSVAVYDDGTAIFSTPDALGGLAVSRPVAARPLIDVLAEKDSDAARAFIADWVGMNDPVTVLALAGEVGVIAMPEVVVTSQDVEDDRLLPKGAQALPPSVLSKIPPADLDIETDEFLDEDTLNGLVAEVGGMWQFPADADMSAEDMAFQVVGRRWSETDNGTAMVATVWWLTAMTRDACRRGDLATATRYGLILAGLPTPRVT